MPKGCESKTIITTTIITTKKKTTTKTTTSGSPRVEYGGSSDFRLLSHLGHRHRLNPPYTAESQKYNAKIMPR